MEEQVKSALTFLLQSHIPTATARDIDEIVLSYVMGILEDLVEESDPSQAFDSDSFMEMIVAYLPQLEGVDVSTHLIDFTRPFFIYLDRRPTLLSG